MRTTVFVASAWPPRCPRGDDQQCMPRKPRSATASPRPARRTARPAPTTARASRRSDADPDSFVFCRSATCKKIDGASLQPQS